MTRGPYPGPVAARPLLPGALSRLSKVDNAVGECPPGVLPRDQMIIMPLPGCLGPVVRSRQTHKIPPAPDESVQFRGSCGVRPGNPLGFVHISKN